MTPEEIEEIVLLASDASDMVRQQQANSLLSSWASSADPGSMVESLLMTLSSTRREVVLFYALTTLLNIRRTEPEHRAALRRELFSQLTNPHPDDPRRWSPAFLRTKAGVVLARHIQTDFPRLWPDAFAELQSVGLLQRAPDIFLRTLIALMDDFGKDETEANTRIKDWLRGYKSFAAAGGERNGDNGNHSYQNPAASPRESISGQLLLTTVTLLAERLGSNGNGSNDDIALLALTALKGFMSWVDLSLLMERQVLRCVFTSLAMGSATDSPTADAGVVAVECLQEMVARGMEDEKKISILAHTGVFEKIHAHVNLDAVDASPIDVVLEVAKFINLIGLEILDLGKREQTEIIQNQLLELFFRCYAYDDIDVSGAVVPLAGSWVVSQRAQDDDALISQLLAVTYRQMRYPEDFRFDYEDEDEAEEEMYRTELRKLHQKLVRAAPDASLQFTCQTLSQLPSPLSTAPTPDIEAALRLVYHYCEGIRPAPGMKVVMKNETFRSLLVAIHTSDISFHSHREVLTLYYEMAVRYHPLLKDQPDLLRKTLGSLTGSQGLQHGHPRVRSRCCYLLLRLVKSVGSSSSNNKNGKKVNVLRPYVETVVAGIQTLIGNSSIQIRTEDALNMFETIGLLIGKTGLEPEEQQRYLTQVMTPHVRSIEQILEQKQVISTDPDTYGELLSSSIAAIAYLSKGFKQPAYQVRMVLLETMKINLAVLDAMPSHSQVRNKCFVLLQRSIILLEEQVLPSMKQVLYLLIEYSDSNDILDVAQLMNQLCIKFQAAAIPAMDAALLPFLRKCHSLVNSITAASETAVGSGSAGVAHSATDAPPHLRTEQLSVQKLIFVVLQHITSHKATALLLTPTNVPNLESILQSMGDGAIHIEEALMKKTCLVFFRELTDQWCAGSNHDIGVAPPPYVAEGYLRFVSDVLVPGVIQSFCRETFRLEDANHWRSLLEFAGILHLLQERLPREVYQQEVLVNALRNRLGCPQDIVEYFAINNDRVDRKRMEGALKNLILRTARKHETNQ